MQRPRTNGIGETKTNENKNESKETNSIRFVLQTLKCLKSFNAK